MSSSVSVEELKTQLLQRLSQVASGNERLIVLEGGKPIAALVRMEDLQRLEALDAVPPDTEDTEDAGHPIMRVFGLWKEREDLDDLIAEIYTDRRASTGREVSL